jgi:hypothetical protein
MRKIMLMVAVVMLVTTGIIWAESTGTVKGKEIKANEILEILKFIEMTKLVPNSETEKKANELKKVPSDAITFIKKDLVDKKKKGEYRLFCLNYLEDPLVVKKIPDSLYKDLYLVIYDEKDDIYIRLKTAGFLLRNYKKISTEEKEQIKKFSLDKFKDKRYHIHVRGHLLPLFVGDADVENILLDLLKDTQEMPFVLSPLGKIKSKKAMPIIVDMLNSKDAGVKFAKVRGYLALGDIGGDEACKRLIEFFDKEKDYMEKSNIINAIGRTRSKMAEQILLKYLDSDSPGSASLNFYAALDGLKYYGDPAMISHLEEKLKKEQDQYRIWAIKKTIEAIKNGDITPIP